MTDRYIKTFGGKRTLTAGGQNEYVEEVDGAPEEAWMRANSYEYPSGS